MPTELANIIKSWEVVSKSPYSDSFYDITNKSWDDNQTEPFYRVADHWNFTTSYDTRIHCKTDKKVPNDNSTWVLAQYQPNKGVYKVIKTWLKTNYEGDYKKRVLVDRILKRLNDSGIGYTIKGEKLDNPDLWRLKNNGYFYLHASAFLNKNDDFRESLLDNFRTLYGAKRINDMVKLISKLPEKELDKIRKEDYAILIVKE